MHVVAFVMAARLGFARRSPIRSAHYEKKEKKMSGCAVTVTVSVDVAEAELRPPGLSMRPEFRRRRRPADGTDAAVAAGGSPAANRGGGRGKPPIPAAQLRAQRPPQHDPPPSPSENAATRAVTQRWPSGGSASEQVNGGQTDDPALT